MSTAGLINVSGVIFFPSQFRIVTSWCTVTSVTDDYVQRKHNFFCFLLFGVNNRESTTDDISIHATKRNLFQGKNFLVKFGLDNLRLIPNFF